MAKIDTFQHKPDYIIEAEKEEKEAWREYLKALVKERHIENQGEYSLIAYRKWVRASDAKVEAYRKWDKESKE